MTRFLPFARQDHAYWESYAGNVERDGAENIIPYLRQGKPDRQHRDHTSHYVGCL